MKRYLPVFIVGVGLSASIALRGQAPAQRPGDTGPDNQGATLKAPWNDAPAVKSGPPTQGGGYQSLWNPVVNSGVGGRQNQAVNSSIALPPSNNTGTNRDIELTKEAGPWVIFLTSYSGERAPQMARKCVSELRTNVKYRLPVYVFNYGAEEKRKEYERVQKEKEELKRRLAASGIQADQTAPIRVRAMRIDEQTGVLIAKGYRTREAAEADLKVIQKLPIPDPDKVDMGIITTFDERVDQSGRTPKVTQSQAKKSWANPFVKAFVARNPCWPKEVQTAEEQKMDLELLHKLNDNEPLSLLKCKGAYTLVVKQFNTQVMLQAFNNQMKQDTVDYAAQNARCLAGLLLSAGADTHLMHTRYSSFVTIGSFDRLDDPLIKGMQDGLNTFVRTLSADGRYAPLIAQLDLPPQAQLMVIPH